ncbi:MAG: HEAT repeat domain-containing protein [Myxococcales bacterium]
MRIPHGLPVAVAFALAASGVLSTPVPARGEGWVGPLSRIEPDPGAIRDPAATLQRRIARANRLGRYGPARGASEALARALEQTPPPALRDAILRALARRAHPVAVPALARQLEAAAAAPVGVAVALSAIGTPEALAALAVALRGPVHRAVALRGLSRAGEAGAAALADALTAGELEPPGAAAVVQALGRMGPTARGATVALEALLRTRDPQRAELRLRAAGALGHIGGVRASRCLVAQLDAPEPALRRAAAAGLSRVAQPAAAPAIARALAASGDGGPDAVSKGVLLRALARADGARALPHLRQALGGGEALRAAARQVLVGDTPDPTWLPLLRELAGGGDPHAASALVRLGPAGLRALIGLAASRPEDFARPLAVGLRSLGARLAQGDREAGLALLGRLPAEGGPRSLLLRALARDGRIAEVLRGQLGAGDPAARAWAARAAELLGDRTLAPAVARALRVERDPAAFRRLCDAARVLGANVEFRVLEGHLRDPATGPEAIALAAAGRRELPGAARQRLRVALRRLLAAPVHARLRAAAARGLGALNDMQAHVALSAALGDPSADVRRAAARALAALGGARVRTELTAHARIEGRPELRRAVAELTRAPGRTPLDARGRHVLEVQISTPPGAARRPGQVDVLLSDGRWLRLSPLPGGELLVADLPAGQAELRVLP